MIALWHRIPFKYQLIGAFAIITLLAMIAVYSFASLEIQNRFGEFVDRADLMRARQIRDVLTVYYHHNGSWQGIEQLANPHVEGADRFLEAPFALADRDGKVIISTDDRLIGRNLSESDLSKGLPIRAQGERVGTVFIGAPKRGLNPVEKQFLDSVQVSTLWAGGLALILSVGLGFLLVRRMARPLSELRVAAEKISQGKLESRVNVTSDDELGLLGQTFNQMTDSLQRSENLRRQMVMDVAHELRTPLMVQQSHLELLLDKVAEPTPQQLETIYEQNLLLGRLVKDLQVLAVAESGELKIERASVSLKETLESIAEHVRPAIAEKEISLHVSIPENLPTLCVDRQRIEQVLLNLLDNARRHTPQGSAIELHAELQDKQVQISVLDQGPGILPEELPYLFERFYRADQSRSRQSGGFGLGLAIAKHLVEAHGGRIWAEASAPGQGAVFRFTLPI
ncbi:HAMP domain-containing protein [Candidatus Acetothermia bacterium]|nr:HAMP domain-containing protein [Candidatus Acetothermia bacterium]